MNRSIYLLLIFLTSITPSFGQMTSDNEWLYKNGEKFFPIGIWYPRGYNPLDPDHISTDAVSFNREFGSFNTIYIDQGKEKSYMQDKVLLVGNGEFDDNYINSSEQTVKDKSIDATTKISNYWKNKPYDYLYILDEPLSGLKAMAGSEDNLYIMLNNWNHTLKTNDPNSLTFLDFVIPCPLDYNTSTPCNSLGDFTNQVSYDIASHQHYSIGGDAIRNGTQYIRGIKTQTIKPSFLFLEANKEDPNIDDSVIYRNANKAKAYTSIIYGATGVMFWRRGDFINDADYSSDDIRYKLWEATKELALELKNNQHIFKGDLLNTARIGNLHTGLFKGTDNKYYYIAVNGSHDDNEIFHIPNIENKTLQPLEVYIAQPDIKNIPFLNNNDTDDILIRNSGNTVNESKFYVALSNGTEFPYSPDTLWKEGFGVASQELKIGDFDGDGKDDLLIWNKGVNQSDSKYYVSLSNGINEFKTPWPSEWLNNFGDNSNELHIGDFNGDGRDDLLIRDNNQSKFYVMLSNGKKFVQSSKLLWEEGFGVASQELKIGDFNGDGKDDLLIWNKGVNQSDSKYYVSLSNGIDEFKGAWPSLWLSNFGVVGQELKIGDFNGDDKDDLLIWNKSDSKFFVALSNGVEFPYSSDTLWEEGFGTGVQELKIGDFNRDGLDDILIWKKGPKQIDSEYRVALSNGINKFKPSPLVWLTNFGAESQELFVGDFDGNNSNSSSAKMNFNKKNYNSEVNFNPNPFKEKLYIQLNLDLTSNIVLNVFGIGGNQIIKQKLGEFSKGEKNISIPSSTLSRLTKGIYIAKILVENKSTKRIEYKKIIKLD